MFHPYGSRVPDRFPLGERIMRLENGTELILEGWRSALRDWRDYNLTARLTSREHVHIANWHSTPGNPAGAAQTEFLAPSIREWLAACVSRDAESDSFTVGE